MYAYVLPMDVTSYIMDGSDTSMDASMEPKSIARRLSRGYRDASGMDSHDTTSLRPVEELLEAYPDGVAENAIPGIAYGRAWTRSWTPSSR